MSNPPKETVGTTPSYWTHNVGEFPGPVAVTRMAQLIDFDDRLYEAARVVYRFLISWYHDEHGDALVSMRHVSKVMKQRAPSGAVVPSRSAVHRAIIALMETGWVVRTFKGRGKGKGASRFVPVLNVLDLAAAGKFPEPSRATGTVEPSHSGGTVVSHSSGTVEAEPSHLSGTKTLPPDPATEPGTRLEDIDRAPPVAGLSATTVAQGGFEELYSAYGVRKEYAAAKIAYEKFEPAPELHAEMVAAAKAWRATAGSIERMHLARWIREERFREDPKGERKPREQKAKPAASSSATPAKQVARVCQITAADVSRDEFGLKLCLFFEAMGDRADTFRHAFYVEHHDYKIQAAGVEEFTALCRVMNLPQVDDSEELMFHPLLVTQKRDGSLAYDCAPATFDMQEAA